MSERSRIERFFERYEEGANTFDPELIRSQFADCFAGADPNGVACLRNDDAFVLAIPERAAFFRKIGFRGAKVLAVEETPLDDRFTMAKVHWRMEFEKTPGRVQEFRFPITYFLFDSADGLKVVFYISHEDERKTMREGGLL